MLKVCRFCCTLSRSLIACICEGLLTILRPHCLKQWNQVDIALSQNSGITERMLYKRDIKAAWCHNIYVS